MIPKSNYKKLEHVTFIEFFYNFLTNTSKEHLFKCFQLSWCCIVSWYFWQRYAILLLVVLHIPRLYCTHTWILLAWIPQVAMTMNITLKYAMKIILWAQTKWRQTKKQSRLIKVLNKTSIRLCYTHNFTVLNFHFISHIKGFERDNSEYSIQNN